MIMKAIRLFGTLAVVRMSDDDAYKAVKLYRGEYVAKHMLKAYERETKKKKKNG